MAMTIPQSVEDMNNNNESANTNSKSIASGIVIESNKSLQYGHDML